MKDQNVPTQKPSTPPADKYLVGKATTEDVRGRVSLSPTVLTEALITAYRNEPTTEKILMGGKERSLYKYSSKGLEFGVVSLSEEVDVPKIINTAKDLLNYADQNGKLPSTEGGTVLEITINDYLRHLGYSKRADGSHKPEDRRKVWSDIKSVLTTPVKLTVPFTSSKGEQKTLVIETPIVSYGDVYDETDPKKTVELSTDTPPEAFIVSIANPIFRQMTGFREGGKYYRKNLITEPKREALDYKHDLQGYNAKVSDYIFYKFNEAVQNIRYYPVKEIREVINGREKDQLRKLASALDTLESRGEIKTWGFASTNKTKSDKDDNRKPLVWVDHSDTPAYIQARSFYKENPATTAEKVNTLEKTTRKLEKRTDWMVE